MKTISSRLNRRRQKPRQRSLLRTLRGTTGAIDLASIMTGVLVLGIIGGVISATVFAVIPWAQDNATKADLGQVRLAEGVYAASHAGGYADLATIQAPTLLASGSGGPGQPAASISAAGKPLLPASDPARRLEINANANGFVAAEVSPTGRTFYVSSLNTTVSSSAPTVLPAGLSAPAYYTLSASIAVGGGPMSVAVDSATDTSYVTNMNDGSVSVIDNKTNTVKATIAVSTGADHVAVNDKTNLIYVTSQMSPAMVVIDGATNTVKATIALGSNPSSVGVNTTTNTVYTVGPSITVIDGATNTVKATIAVKAANIAINETTNEIAVTDGSADTMVVIDGATNTVKATLPLGTDLGVVSVSAVSVNTTTNTIYVVDPYDGWIWVIDGKTDTKTSTIPVASPPQGSGTMVVDSSANVVYVLDNADNAVSVIDGSTGSVSTTVPAGPIAVSLAQDTTLHSLYVTNNMAGTVSVITAQ